MEIKLNTSIDSVPRVASPPRTARAAQTPQLDGFASSHALETRLAETPDARPEVVEKARVLISDPAYPPNEAIRKIATLLAMEMQSLPREL